MRVAGYVREAADPSEGEPAFVQHERIRRWAAESGHHLVAVCQDTRQAGYGLGRDGYLGLLGVIAAGEVDAVVVPDPETFSADVVSQEIMRWDLSARGVAVLTISGDEENDASTRQLVRHVLARLEDYGTEVSQKPAASLGGGGMTDVIVQLVAEPSPSKAG